MDMRRRFELAATMVFESGKPWREADGDVAEAIDYLRYYADEAERSADAGRCGHVLGEDNEYIYEAARRRGDHRALELPAGDHHAAWPSRALAAGNCAILKPAAQSPIIAAELVEHSQRGRRARPASSSTSPAPASTVGQALVEHPTSTSSPSPAARTSASASSRRRPRSKPGQRNVKRVIAEMGGKNAIIVDEDADLDQAVAGVVASRLRLRRPEVQRLQPPDRRRERIRRGPRAPRPRRRRA